MQDYDADSNPAIDQAFKDGLYIGGVRYVVTGKQSGGVYARKVRAPSHRLFINPIIIFSNVQLR